MNSKKSAAGLSLALFGALSTSAIAAPSWATKGSEIEKCGGVSMAKENDCGANGHACAGKAAKDKDEKEWVYTPAGLCKKLGGKVLSTKKV